MPHLLPSTVLKYFFFLQNRFEIIFFKEEPLWNDFFKEHPATNTHPFLPNPDRTVSNADDLSEPKLIFRWRQQRIVTTKGGKCRDAREWKFPKLALHNGCLCGTKPRQLGGGRVTMPNTDPTFRPGKFCRAAAESFVIQSIRSIANEWEATR